MPNVMSSVVGGLVFSAALVASAQAQVPLPGTRISITGCMIQENFTRSCTGIRDTRTGASYQVNAAIPPLNAFRAVQLTGFVTGEVDFCMMGPVLERITWRPLRSRCPSRNAAR